MNIKLALAAGLIAAPASAQQVCGPRADVVSTLSEKYGEYRLAAGFDGQRVMEIFASEDGTYTVTMTDTTGTMCIMSAGEYFQQMNDAPPKGDPA